MCDRQRPLACTMMWNGTDRVFRPYQVRSYREAYGATKRAGLRRTIRFDFGLGQRVRGFSVIRHEGIGSPICSHSQHKTVGRGAAGEFLKSKAKAIIGQGRVWQTRPIHSRMRIIDRFKFTSSKWRSTLTNEEP